MNIVVPGSRTGEAVVGARLRAHAMPVLAAKRHRHQANTLLLGLRPQHHRGRRARVTTIEPRLLILIAVWCQFLDGPATLAPLTPANDDADRRSTAARWSSRPLPDKTLVHSGQCTKVRPALPIPRWPACWVAHGRRRHRDQRTGGVTRDDTVAVIGCGGVGDAAITGAAVGAKRSSRSTPMTRRSLTGPHLRHPHRQRPRSRRRRAAASRMNSARTW